MPTPAQVAFPFSGLVGNAALEGTLPVANGGLGVNTLSNGELLVSSSDGSVVQQITSAKGALSSSVADGSVAPSFISGTSGQVLTAQADGTVLFADVVAPTEGYTASFPLTVNTFDGTTLTPLTGTGLTATASYQWLGPVSPPSGVICMNIIVQITDVTVAEVPPGSTDVLVFTAAGVPVFNAPGQTQIYAGSCYASISGPDNSTVTPSAVIQLTSAPASQWTFGFEVLLASATINNGFTAINWSNIQHADGSDTGDAIAFNTNITYLS